jgi:beta-lactamase class C
MKSGILLALMLTAAPAYAAEDQANVKALVDAALTPVMAKYRIPGMAVGVAVNGKSYVFAYGMADRGKPVTHSTLFELGSISKTFLVTLVSLEREEGALKLTDTVDRYLPEMKGTAFGTVPLMNLATHVAGGFPLQVPDAVKSDAELTGYFQHWKPSYPFGAMRTYANPSIGMLGVVAAKAAHQDFASLMEAKVFPALGLKNTYIHVPAQRMGDYAMGHTRDDKEARVNPGPLADEAYGVKSNAGDMLRFVEENMKLMPLDAKLQRAVIATHTGYFQVGAMTQDLIWEQYDEGASRDTLLAGNSNDMLKPTPVTAINPPASPRDDAWINKTGSTNGFGAYLAFIPAKKIGIAILANKYYPNEDRVAIAYEVLNKLK